MYIVYPVYRIRENFVDFVAFHHGTEFNAHRIKFWHPVVLTVAELPSKKQGRPYLLGKQISIYRWSSRLYMCKRGAVVNSTITISIAYCSLACVTKFSTRKVSPLWTVIRYTLCMYCKHTKKGVYIRWVLFLSLLVTHHIQCTLDTGVQYCGGCQVYYRLLFLSPLRKWVFWLPRSTSLSQNCSHVQKTTVFEYCTLSTRREYSIQYSILLHVTGLRYG